MYVCMFSFFVYSPSCLCIYIQFLCCVYLQWVTTNSVSQLAFLVAHHFIVESFLFLLSNMFMATKIWYGMVNKVLPVKLSPE